jgi:hypothetical protein
MFAVGTVSIVKVGWLFEASACSSGDCGQCPLVQHCVEAIDHADQAQEHYASVEWVNAHSVQSGVQVL